MLPRSAPALLELRDLVVATDAPAGQSKVILHGLNLSVRPGEIVAIVGESGSGKSTLAKAILGLLPATLKVSGAPLRFDGQSFALPSERGTSWQARLGRRLAYVPQDPSGSLDPLRRIGAQVLAARYAHGSGSKADGQDAASLLRQVGIHDPERVLRQYPHELSGGMRQRVLIAAAMAMQPALVLADEPTSALDTTVQKKVLDVLQQRVRSEGSAAILITHDLGIAIDRADRIVVLQDGRVVDERLRGLDTGVQPLHPYAQRLVAALQRQVQPRPSHHSPVDTQPLVAQLVQVQKHYGPARMQVHALKDVTLALRQGETLALVGESGSGKTTLARIILQLIRPSAGSIQFFGEPVAGDWKLSVRRLFWRRVQPVYQNPDSSLDPRWTVARLVAEPLDYLRPRPSRQDSRARVLQALSDVGLGADILGRRPGQISGGQRQRVAIARALITNPQVLVLDEALSALDVITQQQILRLLAEQQRQRRLTLVFVSHDLAAVAQLADRVAVLHKGQIVEQGELAQVFSNPQHPHTRDLLAARPGSVGLAQFSSSPAKEACHG